MAVRAWPQGTQVGDLIGASFGVVFIVINVSPMPPAWRVGAIAVAAALALVITYAFSATQRAVRTGAVRPDRTRFNRLFLVIVVLEAIALFGGLAIVRQLEPAAVLGWIALVVGVHFLALAQWWIRDNAPILLIGVGMTILGLVGLWVGLASQQADAVMLVSGVGSGLVLLGVTFSTAVRTLLSLRARQA